MKKLQNTSRTNILFAAVFSASLLFSSSADAFFGLLFGGPVFEPTSTASELAKNISTAVTQVRSAINRAKQEIGNARSALSLNFNSAFGLRLDNKPIAGAKVLEEPSVDPLNESEVKQYVYKLFLTYPSHEIPVQAKYRKMAQDFYDDSVLEAYSAAREIERYLSNDVAAKFAELQSRLHESGGDGASSPEALNEALYNNYLAFQTIDTIARVLQETTAIKSQLRAARAISDVVEPLEYPAPDQELQGAALKNDNLPKLALNGEFSISGHEVVAGAAAHIVKKPETLPAQVTLTNGTVITDINENTAVEVNVETKKVNPYCTGEGCETYEYNEDEDMYKPFEGYSTIAPGGTVSFSQSDDPTLEHPFYDARYKMNETERMQFIYDKITTALDVHNLIKKIRQAKDDIESYKRAVALHEKSLRMLRLVDKCAVTMLSNNFSDASSVWCGQNSCDNVISDYNYCPALNLIDLSANSEEDCSNDVSADYAARSGVSGWAVDQYDLGRAALSGNFDVKEIAPAPTEDDIHVKDIENVEKEAIPYAENVSGKVLDENAQYEAEARKMQLLPWEIGAIAAKTLAESPETWGTLSNPYPVWNDQKNFYSQYLDGKYINLPQYLQFIGQEHIFELALPVANVAAFISEVKAAKAALESAIDRVNANKLMTEEEKAAEIKRLKEETDKKIAQLEKDKATNDAAIPSVVALSRDATYPNLWEMNADEDGLLNGELKSAFGMSLPVSSDSIVSKTILNKFKEEELPEILSSRALELGSGVSSAGGSGGVYITMGRVVSDAQTLTRQFISDMKAQIKALRERMCAMGDSLYYSVGTAPSMHQSMMQALAAIVYEVSDAELGVSASMKPWEATIKKLDISEDSKTFIGVKPLTDREAKAPRAPLKMGYPPVREIFHFDDYDYENAAPGSRKSFVGYGGEIPELWKEILADKPFVEKDIDLTKILDSGVGTNTLLRGGIFPCNMTSSFVGDEEQCYKDTIYNVEHKQECGAAAAAGEDVSQCLRDLHCGNDYFNNAVIGGLDNRTKSTELVFNNLVITEADYAGGEVNPCINYSLNITESGERADSSKLLWKSWPLYHETVDVGFMPVKDNFDPTLGRSELGIFLQTPASGSLNQIVSLAMEAAGTENSLKQTLMVKALNELMSKHADALGNDANTETTFREEMKKVYDALIEILGKDDGNEEAMQDSEDAPSYEKLKKVLLGYAPFQENQVGGFLEAADTERNYREKRKELEKAIRQLELDLAEALSDIGYQLTNAFSLINPEDYDLSMSLLDETKNELVTEIDTRIKNVKVGNNKIVKYRLREFNRILLALTKDKDELVTIAEGVDSGPNFDEIIKMEEANEAVREEYRQEEENAFKDAMNDLGNIYCANYNEGAYDKNMCRFPVYPR